MEGYKAYTGSNIQNLDRCCKLHWHLLTESCAPWTLPTKFLAGYYGSWISQIVCCGILWILDLASGLYHKILGILDPVEPFCRRILCIDIGSCFLATAMGGELLKREGGGAFPLLAVRFKAKR